MLELLFFCHCSSMTMKVILICCLVCAVSVLCKTHQDKKRHRDCSYSSTSNLYILKGNIKMVNLFSMTVWSTIYYCQVLEVYQLIDAKSFNAKPSFQWGMSLLSWFSIIYCFMQSKYGKLKKSYTESSIYQFPLTWVSTLQMSLLLLGFRRNLRQIQGQLSRNFEQIEVQHSQCNRGNVAIFALIKNGI